MNLFLDKNKILDGLYLISTPIGNLGDISFRAVEILKQSDFILCEDTRTSNKLLNHYSIKTQLISHHKFNEKESLSKIIKLLKLKKVVSLISDAGTPVISDPGNILVKECVKNKIEIFSIPGASAVNSAFSICGFSDKYYFIGFLPEKKSKIIKEFEKLQEFQDCIVFFISTKKFIKLIPYLKKYFLNRKIVICREITKIHEEYLRYEINDLPDFAGGLKGEITVVISEKKFKRNELNRLSESDRKTIKTLLKKLTVKDIVKKINSQKKISKKEIYNYCLQLKYEK